MGNSLVRRKEKIKNLICNTLKSPSKGCPRKTYSWSGGAENEQLGSGEYSTVFRVHCKKENKDYAIKRTCYQTLPNSSIARLNQEAAILNEVSRLQEQSHRFIQLEEGFIDGNENLCIVTELIEGFELLHAVEATDDGLPEEIVKTLMKQILEAVAILHSKDIAHLDLKLENIMLDRNTNEIKIIDFGFACKTAIFDRTTKTTKQILLQQFRGSPHYICPQLVYNRAFNGKKADIWALGVLCYTMLYGRFPFVGNSLQDLYSSITSDCPQINSRVSEDGEDFIMSMLSRVECERPDASTLLDHPWLNNCKVLPPVDSLLDN